MSKQMLELADELHEAGPEELMDTDLLERIEAALRHCSADSAQPVAWRVDGIRKGKEQVWFYWKPEWPGLHEEQGDKVTPLYAKPPLTEPQSAQDAWALLYLHDWDPPKEGQEHRWEPGKNVFPDIHAIYDTWQEAETIRAKMVNPGKYWVKRVHGRWVDGLSRANERSQAVIEHGPVAAIVLRAMQSKADPEIYGASHALKINTDRASKAADEIMALTRPVRGEGKS